MLRWAAQYFIDKHSADTKISIIAINETVENIIRKLFSGIKNQKIYTAEINFE
jgi:uncharacterized membrane-anchored protein